MKTFLSLCSLLFIIFMNSFPYSAANEAVLDKNGKPLQVGAKYYAMPTAGGQLRPTNYPNEECPVTVSHVFNFLPLIPLTFHPAKTKEGIVYASKSLNVKFETFVPSCAKSLVWQVGSFYPETGLRLIQINGVEGNPGCDTFRNWFKLEKVSSSRHIYRFVSDPDDICCTPIAAYNVSTLGKGLLQRPLSLAYRNKQDFLPVEFIKVKEDVGIKQV